MRTPEPTGRPTDRVELPLPLASGNGELGATTLKPSLEHPATSRPPAGRVARLRWRLGERDLDVLRSLARLRLLTGAQLQRLHVHGGSLATRARRTRALLQRLTDARVVVRLRRRVGGIRAGSSGYVYGLSGHGQAVLAIDGPCGGRRRRVWDTSPSFLSHVLMVAELYVGLVEAEREGRVELLDFDAEPACWRTFPGIGGQTVTLKPDAYFRLGVGDVERSGFIEVDLGTESAPMLVRKCAAYAAYWRSGLEQAKTGVFPCVLWLTTTSRRVEKITEAVRRLPAEAWQLFEVALLSEASRVLTSAEAGGAP